MTVTAEPTTLTEDQKAWLADAREMLDFLEANPALLRVSDSLQMDVFVYEDGAAEMTRLAREAGGRWEKVGQGPFFILRRSFGNHIVDINAYRDRVCTRVEVGTETVEVPDPNAPKVTVTRPVFEWQCPESLLALASEDA